MISISIIIPVYNADRFLEACLQSIVAQDYEPLEIIAIDDGSTDKSAELLKQFAQKDPRLKLIQQKNAGPSAARNAGLAIAQGDFVFFLDADDQLLDGGLRLLVECQQQADADLVIGRFVKKAPDGESVGGFETCTEGKKSNGELVELARAYLRAPNRHLTFAYAWGRLFSMAVIRGNNLSFDEQARSYEDVTFNFVDYALSSINETSEFVNFVVASSVNCHDAYVSKDKIFMRSVDLVLTERCSLKCKDCSNLMQYYERPVNYELEQMQQSISNLLSLVDGIQEIRIIGGEPLVNKNFHLVVNRLIDEANVHRIVIYTNGTIAPPDEKLVVMKSDKVMVLITDYGDLSRNKEKLMEGLARHGIAYHRDDAKGWTDCSSIEKHSRTQQAQEEIFQECCAKGLITISNGTMYRCPFSANASQLNAVPYEPSDWVNLENIHDTVPVEAKSSIRSFLNDKTYLKVCDYCSGRPLYAREIPAGVQTHKPIAYEVISQVVTVG